MKKRQLRKAKRKEVTKKAVRLYVGVEIFKRCMKILGKIALVLLGLFAGTFTIYMLNLENKLIYYVVRPFLNKHYDSQKRDRRIV